MPLDLKTARLSRRAALTALGMAAAWYVVVQIFDFTFAPDPLILMVTLVGGAGLTFILGIVGSLPILAARPAEALRSL